MARMRQNRRKSMRRGLNKSRGSTPLHQQMKARPIPTRPVPAKPRPVKPKPPPLPPPPVPVDCSWTDGKSQDLLNMMCGTGDYFNVNHCGCVVGYCSSHLGTTYCAPTQSELQELIWSMMT